VKTNNVSRFLIALALALAAQSAQANTKIADVMGLMADQVTELNIFSRLVAKDVPAKAMAKAESRTRGSQILLALLISKKGTLDANGVLVPDQMTPDTLLPLQGKELEEKLELFGTMLQRASDEFALLETEIGTQAGLADVASRDFTQVKALLAQLSATMREAHKLFR
jgi:hypothetical protein